MAIYFDNSNITTGSRGPEGPQGTQGPQGPAGPNEITANTATSINGLLKGANGKVAQAEGGTDYATPDDAKAFVVTFTDHGDKIFTADKTAAEIHAALEAKRNVIGLLLPYHYVLTPVLYSHDEGDGVAYDLIYFSCLLGNSAMLLYITTGGTAVFDIAELQIPPVEATALPNSGESLDSDTIYAVADAVGTYVFTPPASGWAHGTFTTASSSVSVSFSGTFMGAAPTIEASKVYEFDVFDGVWVVQEVVTA